MHCAKQVCTGGEQVCTRSELLSRTGSKQHVKRFPVRPHLVAQAEQLFQRFGKRSGESRLCCAGQTASGIAMLRIAPSRASVGHAGVASSNRLRLARLRGLRPPRLCAVEPARSGVEGHHFRHALAGRFGSGCGGGPAWPRGPASAPARGPRGESRPHVSLEPQGTGRNRGSCSLRTQRARHKAGLPDDLDLNGPCHGFGTRAVQRRGQQDFDRASPVAATLRANGPSSGG